MIRLRWRVQDTLIGDLLRIDANVAPILLGIGMHCLGCPSSQGETIEEAAFVHGINPQELVDKINEFLATRHHLKNFEAIGKCENFLIYQ